MKKNLIQKTSWKQAVIACWLPKILLAILLLVSVKAMATSPNQTNVMLTIDAKNETVESVLKSIEEQSGFSFFYNTNQINLKRKVSVSALNENLMTVLNEVFKETKISYVIKDKSIILSDKQPNGVSEREMQTIKGIIVDNKGDVIIGANIQVKGTSTGTISDSDGHFTLNATPGSVLEISYLGYVTQYVNIGNKTDFSFVLHENIQELSEIVVVGYGVQKKSVVTAAIGKVEASDLVSNNPSNLQQALQGKASGVQITLNSGQPGSDAVFRIRGAGTINNNTPLFLIDGFPADAATFGAINPNDISSVEVLKDASSAAIYGARAANGVVLVTTKSGKAGKVAINYDFSYGMQRPWKQMKLTNAAEYQMLQNEAYENAGKESLYKNPSISNANTNWQDEVFYNDAPVVNHQLSINGGTDKLVYYLSFGALQQDGIIAKGNSFYDRNSLRSNTTYTLMDNKDRNFLNKLTFGSNLSFIQVNQDGIDSNREFGGIIASMLMAPPNISPYITDKATLDEYNKLYPNHVKNKNGQVYSIINNMGEIGNPLALSEIRNRHNMNRNITGNFNLSLDVLPGLNFKTNAAVSMMNASSRSWTPVYYIGAAQFASNSSVTQAKSDGLMWQWENVLSYTNTFAEMHNVSALIGTSAMKESYEFLNGLKYGLIAEDDDKAFINSATDDASQKVYGYKNDHIISSLFARLAYNYAEKYLFEATVRRDGSSNFPQTKRYATFPSASAGWVLTNESFFQDADMDWFNFLKIRGSWGQNGNENIGAFLYTSNITTEMQSASFGKDKDIYPGLAPEQLANKNLTWETSEQTNVGMDMRFFKNALSVTADYFIKKTKDMIMSQPIPSYVGNKAPLANVGTMENRGVEVDINYRGQIEQVAFNIGGNVSYIKNEVTDLGYTQYLPGYEWNYQAVTRSEVGQAFNSFYGHMVEGIFRTQEEVQAHKSKNGVVLQPSAKPGDFKFRNVCDDDVINGEDRTFIGQSTPDWLFGFRAGLDWNGFDFNLFFQGQAGNDIYDATRRLEISSANYKEEYLNRFHETKNPNGTYPRMTVQDDNNNTRINSFFVHDGSYLRLKNVQLGYSFPQDKLQKCYISRLRVFTSMENALTFTKYKGFDPEVGNHGGIDMGNYPQARIFTLGLNLGF